MTRKMIMAKMVALQGVNVLTNSPFETNKRITFLSDKRQKYV